MSTARISACPACAEKLREHNYLTEVYTLNGGLCVWCNRDSAKLTVYDLENKKAREERKARAKQRERNYAPEKDTRAHYRPP